MKTLRKPKKHSTWSYILAVAVFLLLSCEDFEDVNTDTTRLTTVDPALQVNNSINGSTLSFGNLLCETTVVRQGVSPFPGVLTCANLNQANANQMETNWNRHYQNSIRNTTDAIVRTTSDNNVHHQARIWRAYSFMVVTDTYGDVPYSEAGVAMTEGIVFPRYDPQNEIYTGSNGILEQLRQAVAGLNPNAAVDDRDLLYGGDITRWQRLGNSLLLRAAMRLSEVEPGTAAEYVGHAVNGPGGLMQSNDDSAIIRHNANFRNSVGNALTGGESPNYYLDEVFVDYLRENDDPRLGAIAVRYPGATSGGDQTEANADRDPANQIGMPQGFDNTTIAPVAEDAGLASFFAYSQLDRTTMTSSLAPTFLITYSQTRLLLAEAIVHEWVAGDAAAEFAAGIEAHMQELAEFGERATVDQNDIDAFLQANPLDMTQSFEELLDDINTQYWVSSLLNGPEAWANWRRIGYPVLPANPFPASDLSTENFMRRLTYPDSERSVNTANYDEAVSRQGPDILDTRIWWDTER